MDVISGDINVEVVEPDSAAQADNVRKFFINLERNQSKTLFSSRMYFSNFILRNYNLSKSFGFDITPILINKQDFSKDLTDPPDVSTTKEKDTVASPPISLPEDNSPILPTVILQNSPETEVVEEETCQNNGLEDSSQQDNDMEIPPDLYWPSDIEFTLPEIQEFLSDQDLDNLIADCGDLDFSELTLQNDPTDNTNTASVEPEKVPLEKAAQEPCVRRRRPSKKCTPSMSIEFKCTSNCQVKHVATVHFSCLQPCSNLTGGCVPNYRISCSQSPKKPSSKQKVSSKKRNPNKRKIKNKEPSRRTQPKGAKSPRSANKKTKKTTTSISKIPKLDKSCYVVLHRLKMDTHKKLEEASPQILQNEKEMVIDSTNLNQEELVNCSKQEFTNVNHKYFLRGCGKKVNYI